MSCGASIPFTDGTGFFSQAFVLPTLAKFN